MAAFGSSARGNPQAVCFIFWRITPRLPAGCMLAWTSTVATSLGLGRPCRALRLFGHPLILRPEALDGEDSVLGLKPPGSHGSTVAAIR